MKNYFLLATLAGSLLGQVFGQSIQALVNRGSCYIVITTEGPEGWTVEGDSNVRDNVAVNLKNGVLIITDKSKKKKVNMETLTVRVVASKLSKLQQLGSGSMELNNMNYNTLEVELKGSGDMVLRGTCNKLTANVEGSGNLHASQLQCQSAEIHLKGSGDIKLGGSCDKLELRQEGSGNILAKELLCKTVEIKLVGSGDTDVSVSDKLKVELIGSGDVRYYGEPKLESKVIGSGSGSVQRQ